MNEAFPPIVQIGDLICSVLDGTPPVRAIEHHFREARPDDFELAIGIAMATVETDRTDAEIELGAVQQQAVAA